MGLFGKSKYEEFYENRIQKLWNESRNTQLASQQGYLLRELKRITSDPMLMETARHYNKKNNVVVVLNVYDAIGKMVPEDEILDAAETFRFDDVLQYLAENIPSSLAEHCLLPMAKRCPLHQRAALLSTMDSTGIPYKIMPKTPAMNSSWFFIELCKGSSPEDAVAMLRASPSWNAMDHNDRIFVEFIADLAPHLLPALRGRY